MTSSELDPEISRRAKELIEYDGEVIYPVEQSTPKARFASYDHSAAVYQSMEEAGIDAAKDIALRKRHEKKLKKIMPDVERISSQRQQAAHRLNDALARGEQID